MILFTTNAETKDSMVAALAAHGTDRLAVAGLGRVRREDSALATGAVIAAWPADDDGSYRIALNDPAAMIAWRAFILAEIAAGRGERTKHRAGYCAALGIQTEPAYEYACAAAKGYGVRPCADADHDSWSNATEWVVASGGAADPRKRWARSSWRGRANAHEALAAAGLALPVRNTWSPIATCLFSQPKRVVPTPVLTLAEDDAIASLAA
jgi:hypothetical protein